MDTVKTLYEELFSINFIHSRYGIPYHNSLADDINIKPDKQTIKLFSNLIIGMKLTDNVLICFIRYGFLNLPGQASKKIPFIKFSDNHCFRFLMNASSHFFNKTIIDSAGAKQIYHLDNRSNIGTNNFITKHEEGVNNDDLLDAVTVKADTNCLAVIDIYSSGAISSSYDLFEINQELKSPVYQVRFKNQN